MNRCRRPSPGGPAWAGRHAASGRARASLPRPRTGLQPIPLARADAALEAAAGLATASGSLSAAAWVARVRGSIHLRRGRFDDAEREFRAARELFEEIGAASDAGRTQQLEGLAVWQGGDPDRAEQIVREAIRSLLSLQERAKVIEAQRTVRVSGLWR